MTIPKIFGPGIDLDPVDLDLIQADFENIIKAKHLLHSFTSVITGAYDGIVATQWEVGQEISGGLVPLWGSMFFHYNPEEWMTSVVRAPRLLLRGMYLKGSTAAGVTSAYRIVRMDEPLSPGAGFVSATVTNLGTPISFSSSDANMTAKSVAIDTAGWPAGLYGVRMTSTGTPTGLPWSVVGQVLAYAQ